jgi:toxin HigB-1
VIRTFADKETERIFNREHAFKLPIDLQERAHMCLVRIHVATSLDDLRHPPSHFLESLKGDRKGQHSIRINKQWHVCFKWIDGHAFNVEITDYH